MDIFDKARLENERRKTNPFETDIQRCYRERLTRISVNAYLREEHRTPKTSVRSPNETYAGRLERLTKEHYGIR